MEFWGTSRFVVVFAAGMLSVTSLPGQVASGQHRIRFTLRSRELLVSVGAQPLVAYVFDDPDIQRPYFKDLHALGGIRVTRHHPPREGVDPTDHADFHPGLWQAFGDLNGTDFWRNKSRVVHVEFTRAPRVSGDRGRFAVRNRYADGDRTICEETCEYTFSVRPAGFLILWCSTFRSEQGDFFFGDQEEMGLGIRVATPLAVNRERGGRILDSEGRRDERGIWGKSASWCDYSGWIDESFVGVTIMPDPQSFRPSWWHTPRGGTRFRKAWPPGP